MESCYETMSGEEILFMKKQSISMVIATIEGYETRILDPVLSKVRAGISTVYIEEIPEYQRAAVGETFTLRRQNV